MYNGKHAKKENRINWNKSIVLLAALLLIFTVGVSSTLAYLITSTDPLVNTFTPSTLSGEIVEDFTGTVKKNVKIENTGGTEAYIRAAIVINWVDDSGKVVPEAVAPSDYTISFGNDWTKIGDYYYYTAAVPAGGQTTNLIEKCEVTDAGKAKGYQLSVEILAQGVQTEPEQAVYDSWGVHVSDFISSSTN